MSSFRWRPTPRRRGRPCRPDARRRGCGIDAYPIRLRFPGSPAGFAQGFDALRRALDALAAPGPAARYQVELVFEEIVGNTVRHGTYPGRQLEIAVDIDVGAAAVVLTFEDDGIPFDPTSHPKPVRPKSLADAPDGSRGLSLLRGAAQTVRYQRLPDGRNRLVVTVAAHRAG